MTNEEIVTAIQNGAGDQDHLLLELFEQNKGIVRKNILKYGDIVEYEDARQECFLALMDAVKKYKPGQSMFITFYGYYIKLYLNKLVMKNCLISFPDYKYQQLIKLKKFLRSYPSASYVDISMALEIPVEKIPQLFADARMLNLLSLDAPVVDDNSEEVGSLGNTIISDVDIENDFVEADAEAELINTLWDVVLSNIRLPEIELRLMYSGKIGVYKGVCDRLGITFKQLRSRLYGGIDKLKRSDRLYDLADRVADTEKYGFIVADFDRSKRKNKRKKSSGKDRCK